MDIQTLSIISNFEIVQTSLYAVSAIISACALIASIFTFIYSSKAYLSIELCVYNGDVCVFVRNNSNSDATDFTMTIDNEFCNKPFKSIHVIPKNCGYRGVIINETQIPNCINNEIKITLKFKDRFHRLWFMKSTYEFNLGNEISTSLQYDNNTNIFVIKE